MEFLSNLFLEPAYWILSLTINFLFDVIKALISYKWPNALPKVKTSPLKIVMRLFIWIFSFAWVYGLKLIDQFPLISESHLITTSWIALLSILIYDFGYEKITKIIKTKFKNYVNKEEE